MAINFTEFFKRSICCVIRNPKRDITYAWLVSLVLVFIAFIVACVSASKMTSSTSSSAGQDKASSFSAVWTSLLLILLSVIGTIIMRSYQTALSIGFLIGLIFIMTQQMLIIFALFADLSQNAQNSASTTSAQQAMAVFSFFLFIVYGVFGGMLAVFRNDIIKEEVLQVEQGDDMAQGNVQEENQI